MPCCIKARMLSQNQDFSPFGHCSIICYSHFVFKSCNPRLNVLSFWAFCEELLADIPIPAQGFINQEPNAVEIKW